MGARDASTTVNAIPFVVSLVAPVNSGFESEHAQKKATGIIALKNRFIVNPFSSSLGTVENLIDKRYRKFGMASR